LAASDASDENPFARLGLALVEKKHFVGTIFHAQPATGAGGFHDDRATAILDRK
jgi:hypothetical protein